VTTLPVAVPQDFSGGFYGFVNGTEHTWDFMKDGTYMHRIIGSGGGVSVGTTERGVFVLSPDRKYIELHTIKKTTERAYRPFRQRVAVCQL